MINRFLCLVLLSLLSLPAQSAMLYSDRMLFTSMLGTTVLDDYENPPYTTDFYNDGPMTAVLGETRYQTTFLTESNSIKTPGGAITNHYYCSGCNGSFLLDFTNTKTFGPGAGVYGVGFDIYGNEGVFGTTAFVTFGDNTTANYDLGVVNAGEFPFWGLTNDLLIASIHFGAKDGLPTDLMRMAMDNLTIGSMRDTSVIPVPAAIWLFGTALAGLAGFRLRAAKRAA